MTGTQAVIEMLNGKKIRRQLWDEVNYWRIKDKQICNQNGLIVKDMCLNILIKDDDWEIYDSNMNFFEALEHMKNGHKVANLNSNNIYCVSNGKIIDQNNNILESLTFDMNSKVWLAVED